MLFVSRYVGSDRCGVIDTDDGTEEIVYVGELIEIAKKGVHINGVVDMGESHFPFPYQLPNQVTQLQAKTAALLGVEVVTYNSYITAIICNNQSCDTTIRLSDYGTSLQSMILRLTKDPAPKQLVLVFDDKLELLCDYSLCPVYRASDLRFDVSEVTNPALSVSIYKSLILNYTERGYLAREDMYNRIIDSKERKDLFFKRRLPVDLLRW